MGYSPGSPQRFAPMATPGYSSVIDLGLKDQSFESQISCLGTLLMTHEHSADI